MSDIKHQAHYLLLLGEQYRKAGAIIRGERFGDGYFEVAPVDIETHNCCREREYRKVFDRDMVDRLNSIYHLVDALSKINPVGLVSGYGEEAAGKPGEEVEMIRQVYADKLARVFGMIESINLLITEAMAHYEGEPDPKGKVQPEQGGGKG
ncbi:hypothetical protein [Rufibacter tibetensis]|nr:hypothetical protein [Rufibacter tibetensis]